ncbi:MAG: cation transporter [Rhodobacteraceae bacterium]|nr:MAG: cation transporter [Paracoccaceae bacterium]
MLRRSTSQGAGGLSRRPLLNPVAQEGKQTVEESALTPDGSPDAKPREGASSARLFLTATAVAALGWLALTEGDLSSWAVGAPTVLAAAWAATSAGLGAVLPRPGALAAFAPLFLGALLRSAWSLALRSVARDPRFRPGVVSWPLRLKGVGARAAFMNAVSLTPGTLAARLDGDRLWVHVLDETVDETPALDALERRIARLYGEALR